MKGFMRFYFRWPSSPNYLDLLFIAYVIKRDESFENKIDLRRTLPDEYDTINTIDIDSNLLVILIEVKDIKF